MENKVEEYLAKIRESDGLKNALLHGIIVFTKEKRAEFSLITDKAYTALEEMKAQKISESFLPSGFTATVKIIKRVPDAGILRRKIYEYVSDRFPAAAAFLAPENIEVEMLSSGAHFYVDIASGEQSLF